MENKTPQIKNLTETWLEDTIRQYNATHPSRSPGLSGEQQQMIAYLYNQMIADNIRHVVHPSDTIPRPCKPWTDKGI